ncbi:MAG: BrnT family toxin [Terracidiphilus sp.]
MDSVQDDDEAEGTGELEFEWYPAKAAANLKKHKASFDEAKTVFGDKRHLEVPDREHSDDEVRYLAIGRSEKGRFLTIVFTERGTKLRLISARLAEPWERREYEISGE